MRLIHGNKYRLYKLLAIPYIFLPFLMMVDLGTHVLSLKPSDPLDYYSPLFPCAIIFAIWINDTMAYLVGSFIGRTPFSSISPKKTWEGTIGGIILCVVSITYLGQMPVASTISPLHWAAISFLAAVFGTLGDLLESKMKRMAGLKDSGSFLPGHGGFLDRFDSLLVAVPFVWLYIRLFIHS